MNPDKYMTLLYLDDNMSFDAIEFSGGSGGKFSPEWYYLVRQMPLAEMLGRDIGELADELIVMTSSAPWRSQQRRPIMCGDIICNGRDPWMYVKLEDIDEHVNQLTLLKLKSWPKYGLLSLPRTCVETLICKT